MIAQRQKGLRQSLIAIQTEKRHRIIRHIQTQRARPCFQSQAFGALQQCRADALLVHNGVNVERGQMRARQIQLKKTHDFAMIFRHPQGDFGMVHARQIAVFIEQSQPSLQNHGIVALQTRQAHGVIMRLKNGGAIAGTGWA